jgi:hypothetical protein
MPAENELGVKWREWRTFADYDEKSAWGASCFWRLPDAQFV